MAAAGQDQLRRWNGDHGRESGIRGSAHRGFCARIALIRGEKLLDIQTNLRGAMGPPMTFMLDGKQYVSLQGGQGAAGSGFGGGGASPILPKLLTFVLDGSVRMAGGQ